MSHESATVPEPRSLEQRRRDTLQRLEQDVDLWVATGDPADGEPALTPLSYLWDGTTVLIATVATSPTARNLIGNGLARLGLGLTRDVIMIDTVCEERLAAVDVPEAVGDAFAVRTGFDPRELTDPYLYFRLRPQRIQAWREVNELSGRTLMINGHWR